MRVSFIAMLCVVALAFAAPALAQDDPPPNAADIYRKAMAWWQKNAQGDERTLNDEEVGALADQVDGALTDVQRSAYEKAKPYINMMREAARTEHSDFQLDYNKGFDLLLPHLSQMRNAARVLRLEAQVRMIDGDLDGAMEDLRAVNGLSQHSRTDKVVISSLVSAAMLMLDDGALKEAIGRGAIDATRAGELLQDLDKFRGNDPVDLTSAMRNEPVMASASLEELLRQPDGMANLAFVFDMKDEMKAKLAHETPDSLRAQMTQYAALMDKAATAIANPNREAGRAQIAELEKRIESGDEGLVAQLLSSSLGRLIDANERVIDMLAAQRAMLEGLRDGKLTPESLANAAYAYMRLAALFESLPEEAQRELETARVAPAALDADALERVRQFIAPMREVMQRDFRIATACGRCEFPMFYWNRAVLMPWHAAPLRGAMRAALTDALLGPSPIGSDGRVRGSDIAPAKAVETVAWAIALARHLGSDPSLGHALIVSSVLQEAATALDDTDHRGLITAEDRTALRTRLAQLDPGDPSALHKATTKARDSIETSFKGYDTNPSDGELKKALLQRDATALASVLLTIQAWNRGDLATKFDQRWSPEALAMPLTGFADLVAPPSVEAAKEAVTRLTAQALEGADTPQKRLVLFLLPIPPCDFVAAESRASTALARLLDLTKEKSAIEGAASTTAR